MSDWTLTVDGVTKTLAAWGLEDVRLCRKFMEPDSLTARAVVASINEVLIPDSSMVTLKDPSGTCRFYGKVVQPKPSCAGGNESWSLTALGPWYWLQEIMYQQAWLAGWSTNVFLFLNPDFGKEGELYELITCGEQISDIVNYAIECGAPMRIAAYHDGPYQPDMLVPLSQKRDLRCADAIKECLRCAPDVVGWFDYSTVDDDGTPCPTLYFARASQLPTHDLDLDDETLEEVDFERAHDN